MTDPRLRVSPDGIALVSVGGRAADGDLCDVSRRGGLRLADAAGHTQLLLQRHPTAGHCREGQESEAGQEGQRTGE